MTEAAPHIDLAGIAVNRGGVPVLDGIDLAIGEREVVALVGPSGSGKSTLLRLVVGLESPARGTLRLRGQVVAGPGGPDVPPERRKVAIVFQDLALWPHLSVSGNLAFGLAASGIDRADRAPRIDQTLEAVGLTELARRRPGELSGGERQRAALARALVLEPDTLLLDEPLASVDILRRAELIELLAQLIATRALTAIVVTHSLRDVAMIAQRVVVLEQGRITQDGTLAEVAAAPATAFAAALARDLVPVFSDSSESTS